MMKLVFIIIAFAIFSGCATTQASEVKNVYEKEIVYIATFPCMSIKTVDAEVANAIIADCKRYGKDAMFSTPQVIRCRNGIKVRVNYQCVKKEVKVKKD